MSGALSSRPVVVIGAGVGGLTAAIALAQRGAQVTVLERADEIREVGAGLQISPNGMRVLSALRLGSDLESVSLRNHAIHLRNSKGNSVARLDLLRHRAESEFRLIHRARLIEVLARAARAAGAQIRLGQEIARPPDAPLVVGADGLRSRVREALNGREVPFFTHQTAWRALIAEDSGGIHEAQVFMGPRKHLVTYPLPGGLRNIVAVEERHDWAEEGWSHEGDPQELRATFAEFGGPVPGWLAKVGKLHVWGLFRHEVARRWQDGRLVLLGDAAHPTLPFMAQGAVMAIEDAWVLAACLDADPDQSSALARYEDFRKTRTRQIVAAAQANARNYHFTGAKRRIAHAVLRSANRLAPERLLGRYDWIYDYDPTVEPR